LTHDYPAPFPVAVCVLSRPAPVLLLYTTRIITHCGASRPTLTLGPPTLSSPPYGLSFLSSALFWTEDEFRSPVRISTSVTQISSVSWIPGELKLREY